MNKPNNKKSFALITALGLCILFGAIITGVFMSSVREISSTKRQIGTTQALWLAESAAREKIQEIKTYFDTGEFPKHFPVDPDKDIGKEYDWGFESGEGETHTVPSGHDPDSGGDPDSGNVGGRSKVSPPWRGNIESIVYAMDNSMDIPTIAASAQLISVNTYGSGAGKPPIPGDYIYLLTASATVPILGGSTLKTVQCSVKYSYVAPMNIEVGDATVGEDGVLQPGFSNIIYYSDLNLPTGKYDISYSANYDKIEGPGGGTAEIHQSLQHENVYISLGKTEVLLKEWVDDGEGFDESGRFPCKANDGEACYGEFNIPWDLQTGFTEQFTHIADNGINQEPQYYFQVDSEPFLGELFFLSPAGLPVSYDEVNNDCDLDEESTCSKMCDKIDEGCGRNGAGGWFVRLADIWNLGIVLGS